MALSLYLFLFAPLVFRLFGAPMFVAFGLGGGIYLLATGIPLFAGYQTLERVLEDYFLLSVFFLALVPRLILWNGVVRRVLRLAVACFGASRGGTVTTAALAGTLFGGIAGTRNLAVDVLGQSYLAALSQRVGAPTQNAAIAAGKVGASLGPLAPTSALLLIMAFTLGESGVRVFLGAIGPGLLTATLVLVCIHVASSGFDRLSNPRGFREFLSSLKSVMPLFLIVIIFLVPLFTGNLTPLESGTITAICALLLSCFGYRQIGPLAGVPHQSPEEILASERLTRLFNPLLWFARTRPIQEILDLASSLADIEGSPDDIADAVIRGVDEPEVKKTPGWPRLSDPIVVVWVSIRNLAIALFYLVPAFLHQQVRSAFAEAARHAGMILVTVATLQLFVMGTAFFGLSRRVSQLPLFMGAGDTVTLVLCAAICGLIVFVFDSMLVLFVALAIVVPIATNADVPVVLLGITGLQAGALGLILRHSLTCVRDRSLDGTLRIFAAAIAAIGSAIAIVIAYPQVCLFLPDLLMR